MVPLKLSGCSYFKTQPINLPANSTGECWNIHISQLLGNEDSFPQLRLNVLTINCFPQMIAIIESHTSQFKIIHKVFFGTK